MVVKLNVPNLINCEYEFIDDVVSERTREPNRTFFLDYKDEWKQRISEYLIEKGNPETINDSTLVADKAKFINLYSSKDISKRQTPVISSLRSRDLQFCPACGEDGTPNTLDHYLPKDLYPEYAILTKNLFPMCDICQGKKSTQVLCDAGKRLFLHPYYDEFLVCKSVKLDIGEPFSAPENFTLSAEDSLGDDEVRLVNKHIEKLEIESRYSKYFREQYIRLLKLVSAMRESGLNVTEQIDMFALMAKMKSINSWEHVFYSSVRDNEQLMEFLVNGAIPDNR
ncbi:TPA: hypothetical protein ACGVAJ_003504 [Vibrio vulnificus]